MSQLVPSKSSKSLLKDETTSSENGFPRYEDVRVSNPIDSYGKDWDEMQFLESSVSTRNCNTLNDSVRMTSEAFNDKYARTRRNLGKKISVISNELITKASLHFSQTSDEHLPSYVTKSKDSTLKQLTKQSSVLNPPSTSVTPQETPLQSASFSKASSSKECRPSLLDMARKFSANANPASSDSTTCKTNILKGNSSLKNYLNKLRSEHPRANSVASVSHQSLVPESVGISFFPNSPFKNSYSSHVKKCTLIRKHPVALNYKRREKNCPAVKVKQTTEKKSSEPVENAAKKSKSMKSKKTDITNETIYNPSLSYQNVAEADHISGEEISSWLDEEMIKGTEELKVKDSPNVNSAPQNFTLNSGLGNGNVLNTTPTYIFTPSLPNSLNNTFAPTSMNNNLIYDVNSFALYQPVAPPAPTTVFILPVASNFSAVPNTPGHVNSLPPSQPIVKVACNGMDADSVLKSVCKTFYQSAETSNQQFESANAVCPVRSNASVQTDSIVPSLSTASSSTSAQQLETCSNNLLIPEASVVNEDNTADLEPCSSNLLIPEASVVREDSTADLEPCSSNLLIPEASDAREASTADRGALFLSYFCNLMTKPKPSLEQCRKEANEVLDVLSSFPYYLSVKCFYDRAEEYFSDFCFCDSSSQCTAFKFDENLEECRLNEVLKKYVSFQVKEIVKDSPPELFCVKPNFIFKARNSKLTYFEKLTLKKLVNCNQKIDMGDLIGRLFLVGLVVVMSELKKQNELKTTVP